MHSHLREVVAEARLEEGALRPGERSPASVQRADLRLQAGVDAEARTVSALRLNRLFLLFGFLLLPLHARLRHRHHLRRHPVRLLLVLVVRLTGGQLRLNRVGVPGSPRLAHLRRAQARGARIGDLSSGLVRERGHQWQML